MELFTPIKPDGIVGFQVFEGSSIKINSDNINYWIECNHTKPEGKCAVVIPKGRRHYSEEDLDKTGDFYCDEVAVLRIEN